MIVGSFLITLINIFVDHMLLTRKKSIKYCFVTFLLNSLFVYTTGLLAIRYIHDLTILKYVLYLITFTYIVYFHVVFKESIQKKIFAMFSVAMLSTSALFLATSLKEVIFGSGDVKNNEYYIYLIRICIQLLLLPGIYQLSKPYKKVLELVSDKTINFMTLYPMMAFWLLISNFPTSFSFFRNFTTLYDVVLFLVFISIGYSLVFAGIFSSSNIISLQYNYKIVENQVELQRQNYKKLNESLEHFYALRHDERHHITAIQTMLRQKNNEEALQYVEQLNQNELSKTIPKLCNNFAADSIIKYYMSLADSRNIEFREKLNVPEDIKINPLDLCVVLGNCLENAIEACEKLGNDKKYIEIVSHIVGSNIVFKIVNSFNGHIIKNGQTIQSTKNDFSSHGIGITSVKETVNKYKGNLEIKYTNDEFEVDIIMNINCTN